MGINLDKPHLWKQDIIQSVDLYNTWFILNLSEALATNSYLMLYPKEHLQKAISDNPNSVYRIWESLKGISGNDIAEEGRIYGGGLKKIEPSELAKVSCGDLMKLCFA